jgi:hypothetical protein
MRYAFASLTAALLGLGIQGTDAGAQTVYRASSQDSGVQLLDSWYRRYLGRPVDQNGLQSWLAQLGNMNVEAAILGSPEYYDRHGDTPEGFVTGLYVDVLGRQPAAQEVQGWLVRLAQLGGNRTALADDFLRAAATELSLRGQPQANYQPAVPPIVQQPVTVVPDVTPVYVYSSPWYGSVYRPRYWIGNRYWGGIRYWAGGYRHYDGYHYYGPQHRHR